METIDLDSWSSFAETVQKIRRSLSSSPHAKRLLFRGHASFAWELATTLERRSNKQFNVLSYASLATRYAHELRSITKHKWKTLNSSQLKEDIARKQIESYPHLPCYPYLIYLRHHGFASPLLDWTKSPYVAAYFAFHDPSPGRERVAVFVYAEASVGTQGHKIGDPCIHVRGPFVDTHKRHFSQQAWYTVCTKWDDEAQKHVFCPHLQVFSRDEKDQDLLKKITLPLSERNAALEFLKDANINHFTLFQTEDSLVKTMDMRTFDLGEG